MTINQMFRKILGVILFLSPVWVVIVALAKIGLLIDMIIVFSIAFLLFLCVCAGVYLLEK